MVSATPNLRSWLAVSVTRRLLAGLLIALATSGMRSAISRASVPPPL